MSLAVNMDLMDPRTFRDGPPHALFDRLRRDDPVHKHVDPMTGGTLWSLTRYEDMRVVNTDQATFTSTRGFIYPFTRDERGDDNLMYNAGARHARLRGFVAGSFSPRVVARFEGWIREVCVRIVDDVLKAGRMDAMPVIAAKLPAEVIASILGVPEEDRHLVYQWAKCIFGMQDPEIGEQGYAAARKAAQTYVLGLREMKRSHPCVDVATELLTASHEGTPITDGEYEQSLYSLLLAGFETTHTLIAQSLLLMAQDEDIRRQVERTPYARRRSVTEELLRYITPLMNEARSTTRDVEIGGVKIPEGDFVVMWYSAANRDPAVFDDPHRFDVERERKAHAAFGAGGPHFCVGAHLARLEFEILMDEFRKAQVRLELDGDVERMQSVSVNGITKLPMRVA